MAGVHTGSISDHLLPYISRKIGMRLNVSSRAVDDESFGHPMIIESPTPEQLEQLRELHLLSEALSNDIKEAARERFGVGRSVRNRNMNTERKGRRSG